MEISILLLTYNHEKFVRQTLDSIMMQKINVPYEIIVLDDASTDHTANILKEYKTRYPRRFSLYLRKVNCGSPTKNSYFLLSKAKGNYYAFIEGDDYWTDPLKIQKQYDFMEQHKEFSGCMTDLIVVDEESNEIERISYEKEEDRVYTMDDFRHLRITGMSVTFFARNYFGKKTYRIIYEADKMMGDITTYMLCLLNGNIYQLEDFTSAYRYVCKDGKGNFNSIHQRNIYKDYMMARYWIRLENYMRSYDRKFEFVPMQDVIGKIAAQYSIRSVLHLILQSDNRKRYLLIYLINKFLLDTNFQGNQEKGNKWREKYSWNAFKRNKRPIILFGAGAAAEEYLDKYAWKGNILFIVDNDKSKQNKSFKGFIIKSPDEILRYKNKASILIVNQKHESAIEIQLQNWGIQSYFCYCSMQSNRIRHIMANKILEYYRKSQ